MLDDIGKINVQYQNTKYKNLALSTQRKIPQIKQKKNRQYWFEEPLQKCSLFRWKSLLQATAFFILYMFHVGMCVCVFVCVCIVGIHTHMLLLYMGVCICVYVYIYRQKDRDEWEIGGRWNRKRFVPSSSKIAF